MINYHLFQIGFKIIIKKHKFGVEAFVLYMKMSPLFRILYLLFRLFLYELYCITYNYTLSLRYFLSHSMVQMSYLFPNSWWIMNSKSTCTLLAWHFSAYFVRWCMKNALNQVITFSKNKKIKKKLLSKLEISNVTFFPMMNI